MNDEAQNRGCTAVPLTAGWRPALRARAGSLRARWAVVVHDFNPST